MMSYVALRRPIAALTGLLLLAASAGCSNLLGLPDQGAVQTIAPVEQQTRRVFTDPQGPQTDALPESIVEGFFDAMPAGVQNDGYRVARQFLTASAAQSWDGDDSAVVYTGNPSFVRKAKTINSTSSMSGSLIIEAELQMVGKLDRHGLYTQVESESTHTLSFTLVKTDQQWRIDTLPDGVIISSDSDFNQVFRQVSLYFVDASGKALIPDVRWLSWRNWRTQAVRELLDGPSAWIGAAAMRTTANGVALAVDAVPVEDGAAQIQFNDAFNQMNEQDRNMLVRQIRLTLGDGNSDYDIRITAGSRTTYSQADADVLLNTLQTPVAMYSLSSGHIVSLDSSSPLRVGETSGFPDAKGFAFTDKGGAVLRGDSRAECVAKDGASCGVMFKGERLKSISGGLMGEIWGVGEHGDVLYVSRDGEEATIRIPWLGQNVITAISVSPEGGRMALAVDSGPMQGVVVTGVVRNGKQMATGLSQTASQVSQQRKVAMLTFYNDVTFVYVTNPEPGHAQRGLRQLIPGPPIEQKLPEGTIKALSAGQISLYQRLTVLDAAGTVHSVSGSLDSAWSMADSQVTAISQR